MPMGTLTKTRQSETRDRTHCHDLQYFASTGVTVFESSSAQCLTADNTKDILKLCVCL